MKKIIICALTVICFVFFCGCGKTQSNTKAYEKNDNLSNEPQSRYTDSDDNKLSITENSEDIKSFPVDSIVQEKKNSDTSSENTSLFSENSDKNDKDKKTDLSDEASNEASNENGSKEQTTSKDASETSDSQAQVDSSEKSTFEYASKPKDTIDYFVP